MTDGPAQPAPRRCALCGYDLAGLAGDRRCPECDSFVSASASSRVTLGQLKSLRGALRLYAFGLLLWVPLTPMLLLALLVPDYPVPNLIVPVAVVMMACSTIGRTLLVAMLSKHRVMKPRLALGAAALHISVPLLILLALVDLAGNAGGLDDHSIALFGLIALVGMLDYSVSRRILSLRFHGWPSAPDRGFGPGDYLLFVFAAALLLPMTIDPGVLSAALMLLLLAPILYAARVLRVSRALVDVRLERDQLRARLRCGLSPSPWPALPQATPASAA